MMGENAIQNTVLAPAFISKLTQSTYTHAHTHTQTHSETHINTQTQTHTHTVICSTLTGRGV